MLLLTGVLSGLAVGVALLPVDVAGRWDGLSPAVDRRGGGTAGRDVGGPAGTPLVRLARPVSLLAAVAVGLVLGGVAGLVGGALVVWRGPALLARLEQPDPERELWDLQVPLVLDLLAACLAGGADLRTALSAVGRASPSPAAERLGKTASLLGLGAAPAQAWAVFGTGTGPAAAAGRSLARSVEGGAPVVDAVRAVAAQARQEAVSAAQARARRAGVLAVGPLGLCFLPAFLLVGVVPAVVGLAGPLFATLQ